jgi:hypothetical protein
MDVDRMMDAQCMTRDHIHQNDGTTHLMGGISDNTMWQDYWSYLIIFPSEAYEVPLGAVGKVFV